MSIFADIPRQKRKYTRTKIRGSTHIRIIRFSGCPFSSPFAQKINIRTTEAITPITAPHSSALRALGENVFVSDDMLWVSILPVRFIIQENLIVVHDVFEVSTCDERVCRMPLGLLCIPGDSLLEGAHSVLSGSERAGIFAYTGRLRFLRNWREKRLFSRPL